jgi:exodeoxyribonuclease VII large subunit
MSEASSRPNLPEYSVSEIAGLLKRTVEDAFPFVRVRGEISGLKFASSGHVYFDLKDEKAVLNAIVWKQTARLLRLKPEAGLDVVCTGRITTYPGSSRYQIVVEQIELAGRGALMAMLEERKKKLAAEGLFDPNRKKPLPFLPEAIGVVTSPTGAVIRDHAPTQRPLSPPRAALAGGRAGREGGRRGRGRDRGFQRIVPRRNAAETGRSDRCARRRFDRRSDGVQRRDRCACGGRERHTAHLRRGP